MGCDDPVSLIALGKSTETDIINTSQGGHLLSVVHEVVKSSCLAWQLVYDEARRTWYDAPADMCLYHITFEVFGEKNKDF